MEEVVIIDALRTPIGRYRGQFSQLSAVELGTFVTKALIERNPFLQLEVKQVIFGNVLQAGNGQNPARQIALNSGLSHDVPASTINEVCGSGLKAIALARQAIRLGEAEVILAGGVESMSQAPYVSRFDKETESYTQPKSVMIQDGLTDAFSGKHMGLTAENVAERFGVSRQQQDAFAYASQKKAAQAQEAGFFDAEILPVEVAGTVYSKDEGVRPDTSVEKLGTLRTVFKENGTVTAGNASTINDGASAIVLTSKRFAEEHQLSYLAIIKDVTEVGIDPSIMGISPIKAIRTLVERNDLSLDAIDLFEINEAFAASSLVVQSDLGIPEEKINICGGAVSLGHPIGATGSRIVTTAAYQLERIKGRYGIASLCVGGGLGLALLLERPAPKKVGKKFYQLTREERLQQLVDTKVIDPAMKNELLQMSLSEEIAEHLIENQISEFSVPLGVVPSVQVNDKEYVVPLATEEPSVVAACSNGSKMIAVSGGCDSRMEQKLLRGQIVLMKVADPQMIRQKIAEQKNWLFEKAAEIYPSIVQRGGGLRKIEVRTFSEDPSFLSVDLLVDTQDAMGANMMNTILEGLAAVFREWFSEEILFSILSNYTTEAIVTAKCQVAFEALGKNGAEIAEKIAAASTFAQLDPYRAATHNKGIMNGIEATILATGNDTRAVSAAIHAFAARDGQYRGLSQWQIVDGHLEGSIQLPLALGTVGGATKILPKAQIALHMLKITDSQELGEVIAAVGLAQNLAALRALVSEGIQKGHMSLQARSLALSVGAKGVEIQQVAETLKKGTMNEATARRILAELRQA
ncbi:hydroxymethylglutaryl-CoA reductase, degradative [Enterococcus olivae]